MAKSIKKEENKLLIPRVVDNTVSNGAGKFDKEVFLELFEYNGGSITKTSRDLQVGPSTVYYHMKKDPDFKASIDEIRYIIVDVAEEALIKKIQEGNIEAIKFALKYLGQDRGYMAIQQINLQTPELIIDGFDEFVEAEDTDFDDIEE